MDGKDKRVTLKIKNKEEIKVVYAVSTNEIIVPKGIVYIDIENIIIKKKGSDNNVTEDNVKEVSDVKRNGKFNEKKKM